MSLLHFFMRMLHCLGSEAQVLEDFRVGVGVLERFPLELNGRQCPVDLSELLLVTLFPLQGLQSRWTGRERMRSS